MGMSCGDWTPPLPKKQQHVSVGFRLYKPEGQVNMRFKCTREPTDRDKHREGEGGV